MGEGYGEIKRQEISAEETAEFKERASRFVEVTDDMSLDYIFRALDQSYPGTVAVDDVMSATNLEELQAKAKKQQDARQLYREISEKTYQQQ